MQGSVPAPSSYALSVHTRRCFSIAATAATLTAPLASSKRELERRSRFPSRSRPSGSDNSLTAYRSEPRRAREMVRAEVSVVIDAAPHEVFEYLIQPHNASQWQAGLDEMRLQTEAPVGVGSTLTESRRFLGQRIRSTLQVTTLDPERQ